MEILQERTTSGRASEDEPADAGSAGSLDQQSLRLLSYFETLFRRLMLNQRHGEEPSVEISREEIRGLILLSSGESMMMSNLAETLGVPLSTATHTVDRLVAKGFVDRSRSEADRRVVEVKMSEYGRKFQQTMRDRRREIARTWLEPLSLEERDTFLGLMGKITLLAKPVPKENE